MSIATAITALQGRVEDAYTALAGKGATIPATKNTANLPTTINSIPSGGGGSIIFTCIGSSGGTGGGVLITINNTVYQSGGKGFSVPNVTGSISFRSEYWGSDEMESRFDILYADGTTQHVQSNTTITPTQSLSMINVHDEQCLDGSTLILMADGGSMKRIDAVKVGDKVMALNPVTLKLEADEIIYADSSEVKYGDYKDIWTFDDGRTITTIHPHEFYSADEGKFKYIADFKIGEKMKTSDGKSITLVGHAEVNEKTRHFTIFTKTWNNYFANGILTGNRRSTPIKF